MTTPKQTLYPFAEMFEIETNSTTSVDIWDIPAGTIITMVLAKIKVAAVVAGNITIGDDDDADGFILAADAVVALDTIYGDAVNERGPYLYPQGQSAPHSGKWKVYTAAGKELKIQQSGTATTAAVVDVFVFGYRYQED